MFTSPQQGWITNTPPHNYPRWGSWLLTSDPLLHLQHLPSPRTILWLSLVSIFSFYQPPHMLCWHVACCVCQLVNARCTAADKDQKDITNNRLLTGERDTQVPSRKPLLTSPDPPHHPPTCPLPSPAAKSHHLHLPRATWPLHSKVLPCWLAVIVSFTHGLSSVLTSFLKEQFDMLGKYTYSRCSRELDRKIKTILISKVWSYSQQTVSIA